MSDPAAGKIKIGDTFTGEVITTDEALTEKYDIYVSAELYSKEKKLTVLFDMSSDPSIKDKIEAAFRDEKIITVEILKPENPDAYPFATQPFAKLIKS